MKLAILHLFFCVPLWLGALEQPFQPGRLQHVLDGYLSADDMALAQATPLTGGLSSQVYLVQTPVQHFVVRFLDEQASLPDTLKELWLSTLASDRGLSPKVLHIDLTSRALILQYISAQDAPNEAVELADLLRCQHQPLQMEPFASICALRSALVSSAFPMPPEADVLWGEMLSLQQACVRGEISICHNDLHGLNVVFDGNRHFLIDWTSGGIGIPEFDVVKLTADWSEEAKEAFYLRYYGHLPTADERFRLNAMYIARLGIIFFNRWHRLMSLNRTDEQRAQIAAWLAEGWQSRPLKHYLDCSCDGSAADLYEGSLSALLEFLHVSENQK